MKDSEDTESVTNSGNIDSVGKHKASAPTYTLKNRTYSKHQVKD